MSRSSIDPIALFDSWYQEAQAAEAINPGAMTLATASADGRPSARMVLLKAYGADGFVFFTNLNSVKAAELTANPYAALCFYWKSLARQVRVDGRVERVSEDEADVYFASRTRGSQIGAWASTQSRRLADRSLLDHRVAEYEVKYAKGPVPRPSFWSGFRVVPARIEFWTERDDRLHERQLFERDGDGWHESWLFP